MEDDAILGLFFQRSESAIAALDEKYGARCRGLSRRLLGSDEDAEECVSDAYLGLWNVIPPERPQKLSAYLLRVVRNVSLTRRRKLTAARRAAVFDTALEELADCLPARETTEEAAEARELTRLVEAFLAAQSAENRAVFLRRYWLAESYEDIGRAVGLPVKTVSVRLTRLRKALRTYLTEREVTI